MTAQQFYERVYGPSVAAVAAIEAAGIKVDVAYGRTLAEELRATCCGLASEAAGIAATLGVQGFKPTAKDRQEEMAAFNALGDAPDFEAAVTDFEAQWGEGEFGRLTALRVREMQKQGAR